MRSVYPCSHVIGIIAAGVHCGFAGSAEIMVAAGFSRNRYDNLALDVGKVVAVAWGRDGFYYGRVPNGVGLARMVGIGKMVSLHFQNLRALWIYTACFHES